MLPANGLSLFWLSRFGSSEGWLIWLRKQDHNFVQLTNKNMHACPCPCSCSLLVIDTLGYRLSRSHLLPARAVWRRFLFESRKKAVAIVLSPALHRVLSLSLSLSLGLTVKTFLTCGLGGLRLELGDGDGVLLTPN